jgi:hypothetical protein
MIPSSGNQTRPLRFLSKSLAYYKWQTCRKIIPKAFLKRLRKGRQETGSHSHGQQILSPEVVDGL